MSLIKNGLLFCTFFLSAGCSTVANYSPSDHIPTDGMITVLPFKNNTSSPLAGQKAKNIMEAILVSKNCSVVISPVKRAKTAASKRGFYDVTTKYYLQGNINEWRYKTGLDAEPAVALNFNIIDRSSGKVVYSAVGAKNGWGQESVGSVAQKLILELTRK